MYFDRFKYARLGTSSSVGLFSNTEFVPTTEFNLSCDSGSDRSDNAFFIDRQLERRKRKSTEIEDKIKTHHDRVLEVFRKWRSVQIQRLTIIGDLHTICVPLYTDVVNRLQVDDRYSEAAPHILRYPSQYGTLLDIFRLQIRHNCTTSQFMSERECAIREAISNDVSISIPEWRSYDDRYPWYKMAKIFEHFIREVDGHKELEITPYTHSEGIEYHQLFRDPAELMAVAEKKNLEKLKDLIDLEEKNVVNRLRELLQNINAEQNLLNSFGDGIECILHYAPIYGLSGQCHAEQELRGSAIFRTRIIRSLRRRLVGNLPAP